MKQLDDITAAIQVAKERLRGRTPQLCLVLGSGLSGIVNQLEQAISLPYTQLPGFPASGVPGHSGQLHAGDLFGNSVLIFQGRYHLYEGYSAWQTTAPVRLAAALGCQKVLLTNAAGGINSAMLPGHFMLVSDHLNFTGRNPLIGRPEREFIDLSQLYTQNFYSDLCQSLRQNEICLHRGVLAWMTGPSYETPAEIKVLEIAGADAVSMSTIPEAIIAYRSGLNVVGLSLVSNLASGKNAQTLQHEDVLAVGRSSDAAFKEIIKHLLPLWT